MIDGIGVQGNIFHYSLVIFLVTSAFLLFFYLWLNKKLNMDEEPKFHMMQDEEERRGDERKI